MQHRAISKIIGILVGIIGLSLLPSAQAQFTANFQTNVISGVTSNWGGNGSYIVGSNTFLDALQLVSGGVISNGTSYIGYEASASNNVAAVTSVGSIWSNAHNFYVGYSGAGNQLVITNGGSLVCGPNFPAAGYIGFNTSGSNNAVLIGGTGSVWRTGDRVYVGENGAGNRLTITNGGLVSCSTVYVGDQASSSNNRIVVSGSGSVLTNAGDLNLGWNGGGNALTIADGAKVIGGGYGDVGNYPSSSNNALLVTGSNSVWKMGVPFGSDMYLGYSSGGNSLTISNGGAVVGGALLGSMYIGYFGGNSNKALVTGTGSVWSNIGGMVVGLSGAGNSLTITNGGVVFNAGNATVGNNGSGTTAFISGNGSVWSNGSWLTVGSSTAGAKVISSGGTIGGSSTLAANNVIAIIGSGSVWSNSGDLAVGDGGSGNQFILFNGGSAYNGNAYIGNGGSSTLAAASGGGSVWYNRGNLYVRYSTDVNHLQVGSSSTVIASNAYVGYSGGSFNLADVQGGNFYVTNAAHNAVLEVRCGQLNISSGLLQVDILVCTNACGHISHTGGTLIVGSLVLDPTMDADNDGLPNGWEQAYGLDPLSGGGNNGPAGDPDGDGMSNLQEFLGGTDPTNSASSFHITSVIGTGSDVLVTWMTGIGKTNALQVTAGGGYATNSFTDIFTVTNTTGTLTNFLDVGAITNSPVRYYRVRLVP